MDPASHCTDTSTNRVASKTSELLDVGVVAIDEQHDFDVASKEQTSQLQVPRLLQEGLDSRLPNIPKKHQTIELRIPVISIICIQLA